MRFWSRSEQRGHLLRCRQQRSAAALGVCLALVTGCGGGERSTTPEPVDAAPDAAASLRTVAHSTAADSEESPEGLAVSIDVEAQSVHGRFRHLRFSARRSGEGRAIASFERMEGIALVSTVHGPGSADLTWRGFPLDGRGAATAEELQTMAQFASWLHAEELARIPLDLACLPGAEKLDPAIGAALVLPWQVLLKYQPDGNIPTPPVAAAASTCQHLSPPTASVDPQRSPAPTVLALTREQPFPMAQGYLPLDGEGFAAPPAVNGEGGD